MSGENNLLESLHHFVVLSVCILADEGLLIDQSERSQWNSCTAYRTFYDVAISHLLTGLTSVGRINY